jgi:hypothetical protein
VLKPGGRVQISDISLAKPVSDKSRSDPKLWAECVVGAVVEDDYVARLRAAGLDVEVLSRFDYFAGSVSADTRRVAHGLGAHTIACADEGLTAAPRDAPLFRKPHAAAARAGRVQIVPPAALDRPSPRRALFN